MPFDWKSISGQVVVLRCSYMNNGALGERKEAHQYTPRDVDVDDGSDVSTATEAFK